MQLYENESLYVNFIKCQGYFPGIVVVHLHFFLMFFSDLQLCFCSDRCRLSHLKCYRQPQSLCRCLAALGGWLPPTLCRVRMRAHPRLVIQATLRGLQRSLIGGRHAQLVHRDCYSLELFPARRDRSPRGTHARIHLQHLDAHRGFHLVRHLLRHRRAHP